VHFHGHSCYIRAAHVGIDAAALQQRMHEPIMQVCLCTCVCVCVRVCAAAFQQYTRKSIMQVDTQKKRMFPQNRPILPQKRHILPQKSPVLPQNSRVLLQNSRVLPPKEPCMCATHIQYECLLRVTRVARD